MALPLHLAPYLGALVHNKGSDLHLKAGSPPKIRLHGELVPLEAPPTTPDQCEAWINQTMDAKTADAFRRTNEADYAILVEGLGRFRANAFRARGQAGLICRWVADRPLALADLQMPPVVSRLALEPRGLVLVTGPTGSGKSTTLAAMVDHINEYRSAHILTIEDPIETVHQDKRCSINQREIRSDTADFASALRAAMRQDPDIILVGEMRDVDTVRAAVSAAETGHFVMSTLHTSNAAETVTRIIDFFPPHEHKQVRLALAQSLRGVICQRLVPRADGAGRVCVMEVLVVNGRVAEAIADPDKTADISRLVAEGAYDGMQSFDQHLVTLVSAGEISIRDAKTASSSPHDLSVALKRAGLDPAAVDAA